jgi:hypothetical protein
MLELWLSLRLVTWSHDGDQLEARLVRPARGGVIMFERNFRHLSTVTASESDIEWAAEVSWREGLLSEQDLESVVGGRCHIGEEIPQ